MFASTSILKKEMRMKIGNKEINDECQYCGRILECDLFRQGHGIRQERINIAKMMRCQFDHEQQRKDNGL